VVHSFFAFRNGNADMAAKASRGLLQVVLCLLFRVQISEFDEIRKDIPVFHCFAAPRELDTTIHIADFAAAGGFDPTPIV
jgi:hypothetical protein